MTGSRYSLTRSSISPERLSTGKCGFETREAIPRCGLRRECVKYALISPVAKGGAPAQRVGARPQPAGNASESARPMQKFARIGPIAFHLPETVEDNDLLQSLFPKWDMELIYRKTGIWKRHIAAPGETAADLAVIAAERLFREHDIDRDSIDFVLLCTQSPDYLLPTTACLLQDRLKLPTSAGAGFQSGLLGLRLRAFAGRRPGPQRGRAADYVGHRGDLLEIHSSHRPLAADDFRRWGGRHAHRGGRRAVARRVRLRHRRPRGRHADGSRGWRSPGNRRPQTAEAQALAQRADNGRSRNRQVRAGDLAADDRSRAGIRPVDARQRRALSHAPGDLLPARPAPRAARPKRGRNALGVERLWKHGLKHIAAADARPAPQRSASARQADVDGRLRRWPFLGWLHLDGNLEADPIGRRPHQAIARACSTCIPTETATAPRTGSFRASTSGKQQRPGKEREAKSTKGNFR